MVLPHDSDPGHGTDTLVAQAYDELRLLAERFMRSERPGHTLQPTALVHEAYLRLAEQDRSTWENQAHFKAMAARMIRRILIDHARSRAALAHGGGRRRLAIDDSIGIVGTPQLDLLALDEALEKLAGFDGRRSRVVELRFFGGLTIEETAEALGLSKWTIVDDWELARAWLRRELTRGFPP